MDIFEIEGSLFNHYLQGLTPVAIGGKCMDELADQIVDGEVCMECLCPDGGPKGYAFTCGECGGEEEKPEYNSDVKLSDKMNCPLCGKRVKTNGLSLHARDAHPQVAGEVTGAIMKILENAK